MHRDHSWNESIEAVTSILEKCILLSDREVDILSEISFWLDGIALLVIASCGILLNLSITLFVATRRNVKNLFNAMFISLLCFDMCLLFIEIIISLHIHLEFFPKSPPFLFPNWIVPASRFTLTAIILIHITISLERYVATVRPFRIRTNFNWKRLVKIYMPIISFYRISLQ